MDAKKIGKFIQDKRTKLNLTQEELAAKIYVSNRTISKWETGRGIPNVDLLVPLSEALKVHVSELLSGSEDVSSEEVLLLELRDKQRKNKLKLIIGIVVCLVLCFLEVILYVSGIKEVYAYIIFGLVIFLLLLFDIVEYLSKK